MNKKSVFKKMSLPLLGGLMLLAVPLLSVAALPMPADNSLIYRVHSLDAGNVLKMYKEPGKEVIVNLPHNATWIARRNAQMTIGDKVWEKVSWDDQTGWVLSDALEEDPKATEAANARRQCLVDPAIQDKDCCGYPESAKGGLFKSIPVYAVQDLSAGESLMMYVDHGDDAIAVEIPHNGTNIVKLGQRAEAGAFAMERVRWAGQNGWIDAAKMSFDEAKTQSGDAKRQKCGGVSGGVDFKESEVVCLPAPVIRRLQESGALDAETVKKLLEQADKK
ncbi:hypothetical protein [Thiothrix subterranea]|uniref:SH3b domain-containing protein n=2 Tax=Thiothrix subterranea TaxID=2735563 RepID=A0AA51MQV8_9GAMM|nr:hypothetical protein [Thiothrix subterranea]MDQ5767423.1 hypothetical protein [Thiothrix subterranea]WML88705.1 hypothetical protein RCG00_10060 [Thiothrix subterranea]